MQFERVANISPVLAARVVPLLPDFMPTLLARLGAAESSDLSRISIMALLNALYERIPTFMTSYVSKIIHITVQAAEAGKSEEVVEGQQTLIQTVTQNSPTEVCVEALVESWSLPHERKMLETLTSTLELVIEEGSREDLTASSKLLFDLFLKLFDVRNQTDLKPKVRPIVTFLT